MEGVPNIPILWDAFAFVIVHSFHVPVSNTSFHVLVSKYQFPSNSFQVPVSMYQLPDILDPTLPIFLVLWWPPLGIGHFASQLVQLKARRISFSRICFQLEEAQMDKVIYEESVLHVHIFCFEGFQESLQKRQQGDNIYGWWVCYDWPR